MSKKIFFSICMCLMIISARAQIACPDIHICQGETTTSACLLGGVVALSGLGSWHSSNTSVATVNSSGVITGVSGGTAAISYSFLLSVYRANVTVNPLPSAAPSYNSPVCVGGTLNLMANDAGGNTYAWTGPNSFSSTLQNPSITGVTTLAGGTYSLTVTSAAGCVSQFTKSVTIGTYPTAAPSYNSPICAGSTLNLLANDAGGSTYVWTGPNSFSSTAHNPSITTVTTAASGTYTLAVTSATGCIAQYTLAVTITGNPTATPSYNSPVCVGGTLNIVANDGGGNTYVWTGPNSFSSTSQNPSVAGVTTAASGTYSLTVTNATGCSSQFTLAVTVTSNPTAAPSYNTPVCAGNTLNLLANDGGGNTYAWTGPNAFSSTSQNPSVAGVTALAGGTYSLTVANGTGCSTQYTLAVTITGNPVAAPSYSPVCIGGTLTLAANDAGGNTYAWTGPNSFSATSQNPSVAGVTALASGNYTLTVTNTTGCSAQYTVGVTITGNPTAAPAYNAPVCIGSTLNLTANDAGGNTYVWTGPNSFGSTLQNPSITSVTAAAGGTYTLGVTNPTGCSAQFILAVTVESNPVAAPSYDPIVCSGGTLNFMANDAGGNTYTWAGPNSFSSTTQNPSIGSITTSENGTYSLTVTAPSTGCSSNYTLTVSIGGNPYTVSTWEVAPFTMTTARVHTQCNTYGLTLQVKTDPVLPGTGVTYTWTGATGMVSTANTFSSTLAPSSTATINIYTVAVAYNGCNISANDTIVVPLPSSCPCDYFTVNKYRAMNGLPALSGCSDCDVTVPFHTIIDNRLTSANISDDSNYYIVNDVICSKPVLKNNNFYMNKATYFYIDTVTPVVISHCHFFANNAQWWRGIFVMSTATAAGHVRIGGNTLIENAGGNVLTSYGDYLPAGVTVAHSTGYYTGGMQDILASDSVTFNKNFTGIGIFQYQPSLITVPTGTRLPYTIKNCVFSSKEFAVNDGGTTSAACYPFSWPTVAALKTITTGGTVPTFGLDAYKGSLLPNEGNIGILMQNVGNKSLLTAETSTTPATYEYNYITIGDTANDPYQVNANLFDSLNFGVSVQSSNVKLYNNTMRNIRLTGAFISSNINDCQILGDAGANSNNRFYNCVGGVRVSGITSSVSAYDFTCRNAVFSAVNGVSGMAPAGIAANYIVNSGHGRYDFNNNSIYNYTTGITMQYSSGAAIALNGYTNFTKNAITGKTVASGTEIVNKGIEILDARGSVSGTANGTILIDSNTITGASASMSVLSSYQNVYINDNSVTLFPYGTAQLVGIYSNVSRNVKEIKHNTVTGIGYSCSPVFTGIRAQKIGVTASPVDMSCNIVQDLNVGFEFRDTSFLQWTNNEMRRCQKGMQIATSAVIGQQGSACAPSDNHWENPSCTSCTGCSAFPGWGTTGVYNTFVVSASPLLSAVYVRSNTATYPTYLPVNNGATTATAYSFTTGSLVNSSTACGTSLGEPVVCGAASRPGHDEGGGSQYFGVGNAFLVYPNPSDGNITIRATEAETGYINVVIVNAIGVQVYNGSHLLENGLTLLGLQNLPPSVYLLWLTDEKGTRGVSRILIER